MLRHPGDISAGCYNKGQRPKGCPLFIYMDIEVYEDTPRTDFWMRAVIFLPTAIILATTLVMPVEDPWVPAQMVLIALLTGTLLYLLIPSKLSVLDSSIRIGFRIPFAFLIPFNTVVTLRPSRWSTIGINLPSNMSQSNAVEIVRRNQLSVIITPSDKEAFLTNFDNAIKEWKMYQGRGL
jgi:hypothetical protein